MKSAHFILLLVFFTGLSGFSQDAPMVSLDSCRKLALARHPLAAAEQMYHDIYALKESALSKNYLPQATLSGQASWQSEVTSLPIKIPNVNIPQLPNDNYRLSLDINQLIWDGGATQKQKAADESAMQLSLAETGIDLQRIAEAVDATYFSILVYNESELLILSSMETIQARLGKARAGIASGSSLQMHADVLDAEIIRLEQNLTDIRYNRNAGIYRLSELTGLADINAGSLAMPETDELPEFTGWSRPEYRMFGLQKTQLEKQKELIGIKTMPRVSAFGNMGYGRPGLNMLSDSFEPWAMVGLRFSWNFWDWNITRTQRQVVDVQTSIADARKAAWEQNQRMVVNNYRQEMLKIENQIAAGHRIVGLRKSVAAAAAAQLDQGVITPSEFLTEQNALTQAELNLSIQRIMLQMARLNYINAFKGSF